MVWGDFGRTESRELESSEKRCASTSTSNGVINVIRDPEEEWFSYEKTTENVIRRLKCHAFERQPIVQRNGEKMTNKLQHRFDDSTEEKLIDPEDKLCAKEENDTTKMYNSISDEGGAGDKTTNEIPSFPMRKSLFPHVSPYILFHSYNCKCPITLPKSLKRLLGWKFTSSTPRIVIKILLKSGYQVVTKSDDWSATWNPSYSDFSRYRQIQNFQKVNSFPGSQNLGEKDALWIHLNRMTMKHGSDEYDFMPKTYVLPRDMQKFESMWRRHGVGTTWIIKPPSSGRGQGVKVIDQWWEIPKWHSVIIQRYISNPKLINGSKFDLRVYVLVTSVNPTRIYVYKEGLVRFASVRYVRGRTNLNDKFMHLTNTSVNKQNPAYVKNDGVNLFRGHKWSLNSLWMHLREEGVDVAVLWSKIKDIVIKTIIAAEPSINACISGNIVSSYTCYELYGFDVLLDENYKPWLLEVNTLPSMQTDSPLDLSIKGALIRNVLNIVGYQIPRNGQTFGEEESCKKYNAIAHDYRLYSMTLSLAEKTKQNDVNAMQNRDEYLESILENLTRDDLRQLVRYEDEFSQAGNFEKVFPTKCSYEYFKFFEINRYYDRLFDAWEHRYSDEREEGIRRLKELCEKMQHLKPNYDLIEL